MKLGVLRFSTSHTTDAPVAWLPLPVLIPKAPSLSDFFSRRRVVKTEQEWLSDDPAFYDGPLAQRCINRRSYASSHPGSGEQSLNSAAALPSVWRAGLPGCSPDSNVLAEMPVRAQFVLQWFLASLWR